MKMPSTANSRKTALATLQSRMQTMMDIDKQMPCAGGRKFHNVHPNDVMIASYLNSRYIIVVDACYMYSKLLIIAEIDSILRWIPRRENDDENRRLKFLGIGLVRNA